jgi:hypothetical protein
MRSARPSGPLRISPRISVRGLSFVPVDPSRDHIASKDRAQARVRGSGRGLYCIKGPRATVREKVSAAYVFHVARAGKSC